MISAPFPANEEARLAALRAYQILDTEQEAVFDELAFLASQVCATPIAAVSLIDRDRQWFKAQLGLPARQTSRDIAFCAHAILGEGVFAIADASQDERFRDNPLVTGDPSIRAYAGFPLVDARGFALGTLCVIDDRVRTFTAAQERSLAIVGRQAVAHLELRRLQRLVKPHFPHEAGVLANLHHDLGTPLNAMVAASDLLLESPLTEEQRAWAAMARRASQELAATMETLLRIGREIEDSGLVPPDRS